MKPKLFVKILFLFFLSFSRIHSQSFPLLETKSDTFKINLNNKYFLRSPIVQKSTLKIFLNKKKLSCQEFNFIEKENSFSLSDSLQYSIDDTLIAVYKTIKIPLKKSYRNKKLVKVNEPTERGELRKAITLEKSLSNTAIFGRRIKKSGTILRGFTVGTNKDFSLKSGLRLQLAGKLSDNIDIVAALTDENSPIQPEGNTERLEELDKVFIQIKHPIATAVFGDYELNVNNGTFGKFQRKLQGLKSNFNLGNEKISFAYASSRGKFNSVKFNGIDGVQGPYRLQGRNNERDIVVIAGSEKVYLDGVLMKRGENNDYKIEYSNAEITFTPKRVITSASRIYVDFEYSDRKYKRNFWGTAASANLLGKSLNVKLSFFNESDDKNNPIDLLLNKDEKKILIDAGDDPSKAVYSGISLAKPDPNGIVKGTYTKVDTVINGKSFSYYYYAPGQSSSIYNAVFSFVGSGKGDYVKVSTGYFKFVGIGQGNYLPLIFLPLPQSRKGGNLFLNYRPNKNLILNFELAGSFVDRNEFSEIDDNDNSDYARNISFKLKPVAVNISNFKLGKVAFSLRDRFVGARFQSFGRINDVEFNRFYNIENNFAENEILREIKFDYFPLSNISLSTEYGHFSKGSLLKSDRIVGKVNVKNLSGVSSDFVVDFVSKNNPTIKSKWMRQNGKLDFSFWSLKSGLNYLYENKSEEMLSIPDSLINSSHKFLELSPYLNLVNYKGLKFNFVHSYREEFFPLNGKLSRESVAVLNTLHLEYVGFGNVKTDMDLTFRNKKIEDDFIRNGETTNKTVLLRMNSRMNFFNRFIDGNIYYNTATERTAKLEKVFVRVPVGNGNYVYLGDLNNNGVADDFEFEQTNENGNYILTTIPTEQLFPTIALQANTRWRLNFSKIIKGNSLIGKIVKGFSTETFYRLNEKSKEDDLAKIYLLNLKYFLNDSTTVRGSQIFQNDFYLFRNRRDFSLRYRFKQQRRLTEYSAGKERNYFRENSFRFKMRLVNEINNVTDLIFINNNSSAPETTNRSFEITNKEISTEFSYRPFKDVEVGFKLRSGESKDAFPEKPTIIDRNSELLRITFIFRGKGRLRFEMERTELNANTSNVYIPFEITQGNVIGKNYLIRINFDYRIAANLQTSVSYWGRKKGSGNLIHNLRAEARAYF